MKGTLNTILTPARCWPFPKGITTVNQSLNKQYPTTKPLKQSDMWHVASAKPSRIRTDK